MRHDSAFRNKRTVIQYSVYVKICNFGDGNRFIRGRNKMKKRFLAVLLAMCTMVGVTGCDKTESVANITTITLDGKEYDLSGDFKEVVGSMVSDDLNVHSMQRTSLQASVYDEQGELSTSDTADNSQPGIYASEMPVRFRAAAPSMDSKADGDLGTLMVKTYMVDGEELDYEMSNGIKNNSDKGDIENLNGYVERGSILFRDSYTCGAVYVNGELVDLEKYENDYKRWEKDFAEGGYDQALKKNFPNLQYCYNGSKFWQADFMKFCQTIEELEKSCEDLNISVEEEIMFSFAMQEAGENLEDGKIDSFVTVRYEAREGKGLLAEYCEYYFDGGNSDWDSNR